MYTRNISYKYFTLVFLLQNNFCDLSSQELKFKRLICNKKSKVSIFYKWTINLLPFSIISIVALLSRSYLGNLSLSPRQKSKGDHYYCRKSLKSNNHSKSKKERGHTSMYKTNTKNETKRLRAKTSAIVKLGELYYMGSNRKKSNVAIAILEN